MNKTWVIEDWTGQELTGMGQFKTFDSAWEYLMVRFPNDETRDLEEYTVVETEGL